MHHILAITASQHQCNGTQTSPTYKVAFAWYALDQGGSKDRQCCSRGLLVARQSANVLTNGYLRLMPL